MVAVASSSSTTTSSSRRWPLASKYKTSTGINQSLSLILNAFLMVYAHYGLSAVFVSNHPNIATAVVPASETTSDVVVMDGAAQCNAADRERWTSIIGPNDRTGAGNKTFESSYCSTGYVNPDTNGLCYVTAPCIAQCFTALFNYTEPCANCFADIPLCSLNDGCTAACATAPQSEACYKCTKRCNEVFQNCSGLDIGLIDRPWETKNLTSGNATADNDPDDDNDERISPWLNNEQVCAVQKEGVDYKTIEQYYTVFEVLFFQSMDIAWKNDARLLAVIVVAFSLVWPYTKNVILMFAWYWPMTEHSRTQILLWLRRLGKYTLIDVYVILILIVGVVLELDLNGVKVVARGEPRLPILAFLVATLWEFVHIEWMVLFHHRTIESHNIEAKASMAVDGAVISRGNLAHAIRFRGFGSNATTTVKQFRNPVLLRCFLAGLLLIAIALFAVGSSLDLIRFQTTLEGDEVGCVRTYNLFNFPMITVSGLVLDRNECTYGIWTLVVSFMVFVVAVPWLVHVVHALAFWFGLKSKVLFRVAEACWTFSCVEVFLIALYIIEYKFKDLVDRLAGEQGAALFEVSTELGPGFFVLIAYTICGGFVHYFFSNAVSEYFGLDPHHKVDAIWTVLFGPALTQVAPVVVAAAADTPDENSVASAADRPSHTHIAVEDVI